MFQQHQAICSNFVILRLFACIHLLFFDYCSYLYYLLTHIYIILLVYTIIIYCSSKI